MAAPDLGDVGARSGTGPSRPGQRLCARRTKGTGLSTRVARRAPLVAVDLVSGWPWCRSSSAAEGPGVPLRSSDPGFGDIEVDAVQNQLIVHRVGGYPVDHEGGIKDLYAATIPPGIKVEFSPATLTKTEVQALMDLTASAVSALDSSSRLTYWGLDHIGGNFTVSYAGNLPDSQYKKFALNLRNKRTQGVSDRPHVSDQLLAKVKFTRSDVDELSRLADIKQYYGGSRVHFPNFDTKPGFEFASSGWPVRSPSGSEYLTTAWHAYKPTDPRV